MGWCQEFGLQISDGCAHLMIAGPDSCSCSDCATVCHGRFAGCPIVWSESVTPTVVGAKPLALGSGSVGAARSVVTNGKASRAGSQTSVATGPAGPVASAVGSGPSANGQSSNGSVGPGTGVDEGDLRQLYADLKSEVHRLSQMVERLAGGGERSECSERDAVLREVDARFAWLTKELSDRLVILGNEIVAVKRHLQAREQ